VAGWDQPWKQAYPEKRGVHDPRFPDGGEKETRKKKGKKEIPV
jgi:hypothetical protein